MRLLVSVSLTCAAASGAVVGCGGGSSGTPSPDSGTDSGTDAAASGLVSLTVLNHATPIAGATAIFSDADGHILSTSMTGADGKASATVPAGSSVTVEVTAGAIGMVFHQLQTVFDVQPGDDIQMGTPGIATGPSVAEGNVQVSFPGTVPNSAYYDAYTGTNSLGDNNATPLTLAVNSSNVDSNGKLDVLALAEDASSNLLAYSTDVGVTPAGAGNTANVTMPAWRTDFASHQTIIENASPTSAIGETFTLYHDGLEVGPQATSDITSSATGSGLLAIAYPKPIATDVGYNLGLRYPPSLGAQAVQGYVVYEPIASIQDDMLDFSMLPQLLARAAYVPHGQTTPFMTWAANGSLANASGGYVEVSWGTSTEQWFWTSVVPVDTTEVQFPDLPDSLSPDRVTSSQVFSTAIVEFVQGTMYSDAAAFRAGWYPGFSPQPVGDYALHFTGIE